MLQALLWVSLAVVAVNAAMSPATQKQVDAILDSAGDKTVFEVFRAIDHVVETMDAASQKEHQAWKDKVKKESKDRDIKLQAAFAGVSEKAQQRLIRIILVHQNFYLTQNEKSEMLRRIDLNMDTSIKNELLAKVDAKTLFGTGLN